MITGEAKELKPHRVLIAKVGLDGHDKGAKIIVRALKNSGFEVIYSGLHKTHDDIIRIAIQEDVRAIGISTLSGAHIFHFESILNELKSHGLSNIVVFGGGIIPPMDAAKLLEIGVKRIFTPGEKIKEIVDWLAFELSRDRPD